jgi:MFS family permease
MLTNLIVDGLGLAALAMGIYGLVWGAFSGASSALASELVAEDFRGFAMGLFNSSYSFAAILAPVSIGAIIQTFGYKPSFYFMGAMMLFFGLAVKVGVRQAPKAEETALKR